MTEQLRRRFDAEMQAIYTRARDEADYNATRYLQMLSDHGGLETARKLIGASNVSEGYEALWERGRLDLTVEALVLREPWSQLFSEEELSIAKKRLDQYESAPLQD